MLCGDSTDCMWHLKLPWPDYAVITYACIIYKQDGTAKFNSVGESIIFVSPYDDYKIVTKLNSLISGLKSKNCEINLYVRMEK